MGNLTAGLLLSRGFKEIGCWTFDGERLSLPVGVPMEKGVYAYAVGEQVLYVGLASKSLAKRLSLYSKPGPTQSTNIRLNSLISDQCRSGETVRIFVAHPSDGEWNGLRLKGDEGLEAALIADFDLPWNKRGVTKAASKEAGNSASQRTRTRSTGVEWKDALLALVKRRPNMTEIELARSLFGPGTPQQRVNPLCRQLVKERKIIRMGQGGQGDPFTYRSN